MKRRSRRTKRPPARLDAGGDDAAVQVAMRISVKQQRRVTHRISFAPTFTPTEEEFKEPLTYIRKIAAQGVPAGIVKIVPPAGWKPEFNINVKKKFETYRQALHLLQEGETFDTGDVFNQEEYRAYAEKFREEWFSSNPEVAEKFNECVSRGDSEGASEVLEQEYWNVVERVSPSEVFVDYANNMDTKKYGTPFGNSQVKRPWDLTTLIKDKESILQKVGDRIAGVTTPWLYFGCMFATFCWHVEDHFLYSLNYMHHGADKVWYGIPEACATKFEALLRSTFPDRFKRDPDLMHQLVTMVSPSFLLEQGITVCKSIQQTGDIIITFPRGYHGGFSLGWNCAEAVNFALLDWLPVGRKAVESYQHLLSGRAPTFSHDSLLWGLCRDVVDEQKPGSSPILQAKMGRSELMILWRELEYVANRERILRTRLRKAKFSETKVSRQWDGEPFQCMTCRTMHFFSFCVCPCGTKSAKTVCLDHAFENYCDCEQEKKVLCVQVSDKELMDTMGLLKVKLEEMDQRATNRINGHPEPSTPISQNRDGRSGGEGGAWEGGVDSVAEKSGLGVGGKFGNGGEMLHVCHAEGKRKQGEAVSFLEEGWGVGDECEIRTNAMAGRRQKMKLMQVDRVKRVQASNP
ncbi:hypothetical protein BSKO_06308 [Bryopsis sp. KO-2023]|nr:hypothetical protein BSKO_06308 [Bryopsis sp. KO-2023]